MKSWRASVYRARTSERTRDDMKLRRATRWLNMVHQVNSK